MKKTKYNWLLSFPGYWYTKEGYKLSSIERPARCGYGWYKFKNYEFEARGAFQAQLEAEELIVKDLASFKKALDSVNNYYKTYIILHNRNQFISLEINIIIGCRKFKLKCIFY